MNRQKPGISVDLKTVYLSMAFLLITIFQPLKAQVAFGDKCIGNWDGIILKDYLFNNKLYNVFETQGIFLTSSYELIGDQLIFEVSSGKKLEEENKGVTNYSVTSLQRVIFKKSTSQPNQ